MSYERLAEQGRIRKYKANESEIKALLDLVARDLSTAESMVGINPDWAYNITYNAMLQSSRAYMMREGYRTRGSSQHATVVQFMQEAIGEEHRKHITIFDQMRRKRNRLVYDVGNLVGEKEAKDVLVVAKEFVDLISRRL
jgi:uncharacterized protein (UPF0332 family)